MKLNVMTLADMCALRAELDKIIASAEALGQLHDDVLIDLTPGQPLRLMSAWTMPKAGDVDGAGDPGPILVEAKMTSAASPQQIEAVRQAFGKAGPSIAAAVQARVDAEKPRLPRIAPQNTKIVGGPFSDAERKLVKELRDQGMHISDIAAKMNRRTAAINALVNPPGSAKIKQEISGQPAKVATSTAAAPAAKSEAPKSVAKGDQQPPEARPAPAAPAAGGAATIPFQQKLVSDALDKLRMPKGWDVELDLELAEMVGKGIRLDQIALDLGTDVSACKQRYAELTFSISNDAGRVNLDQQPHLMTELRRRVVLSRSSAA